MRNKKEFKSHGFVNFPTDGVYTDTGEGGMVVFALWDYTNNCACINDLSVFLFPNACADKWFIEFEHKELDRHVKRLVTNERDIDSFEIVEEYLPMIKKNDCISEITPGEYKIVYKPCYIEKRAATGIKIAEYLFLNKYPMYNLNGGVLYLGSSNKCYYNRKTNEMWCATYSDLTDEGKKLIDLLNDHIGCNAKFLTVIDT
jgi:hypothetical protein